MTSRSTVPNVIAIPIRVTIPNYLFCWGRNNSRPDSVVVQSAPNGRAKLARFPERGVQTQMFSKNTEAIPASQCLPCTFTNTGLEAIPLATTSSLLNPDSWSAGTSNRTELSSLETTAIVLGSWARL